MSRKVRIILMLVLLAGVFGYRHLRDRAPQAAPGTPATTRSRRRPRPQVRATRVQALRVELAAAVGGSAMRDVVGAGKPRCAGRRACRRRIDLAVAWIPAKGEAEPDPIVMIAGGPGQSALQTYPMIDAAFADARRSRHVILLDARGTGDSHPLKCATPETDDPLQDPMGSSPEAARVFAERCRDELAKTSDLRHYATTDHIRDLDLLRAKLGVQQLNLVGVSYGTRVAQQYAKRYPAHTRTLVLDSVAPNSLVLGQEFRAQPRGRAEAAVRALRRRCGLPRQPRRSGAEPGDGARAPQGRQPGAGALSRPDHRRMAQRRTAVRPPRRAAAHVRLPAAGRGDAAAVAARRRRRAATRACWRNRACWSAMSATA